ncbi:shikimate dehydrogenase [Georgenia sp. AZ-5]|uniref:shikimate dehydrogenase n=1 Tax=Georgenia sp. AZ-5 TaxID=3367526 RepID=UPI00375441BF
MSSTAEGAPTGAQDLDAPGIAHRAAVLGHPVAHSLSPALHRAAYASLGLGDWGYGLQDVTADQLPAVVAQLDARWGGLSLTMPLKQAVIPLLDVLDPLADVVGAVNTLVVQPGGGGAGTLVGFNTDVHGIAAALREVAPTPWRPVRALVLGARATASSALAALTEVGAGELTLVARSFAGPGSAAAAAHRMGLHPANLPWSSPSAVAEALLDADVVVSTVPSGVADAVADALAERLRPAPADQAPAGGPADPVGGVPGPLAGKVLLDVVYEPWPTPLARAWSAAGGSVAPGWAMLLHQAEAQVRLMTGHTPDVEAMRAALLAELERRRAGGAVAVVPGPFRLGAA